MRKHDRVFMESDKCLKQLQRRWTFTDVLNIFNLNRNIIMKL